MDELIDNTTPCGYCKAKRSLKLYQTSSISADTFSLNRCLVCHAVFLSPRPSREQLDQAYGDTYYGQGRLKFTDFIEKMLDYFRLLRVRRTNRYISPPAKILDIGCGNGRFLGYLIERGFYGYGIELPGKAAERAAQIPDLHLKVGTLEEEDFGTDFFDGICMWHVFEHLTDPKETLRIIQKILKPGGYLMISLPNINSLQSKLFRGSWFHLDPPKHLFFLEAPVLISEMETFGFNLIRLNYFSFEHNPFGFQQSILNRFMGRREVFFELLKGNIAYTKQHSQCSIILQKLFYLGTFPAFVLLAGLEAALKKGGTMELVFKKERK